MTRQASQRGQLTLENTLADLYRASGKQVVILPPTLAHGSKYIYQIEQDSPNDGSENVTNGNGFSPAQIKLQSLLPQQLAFSVGKMPMVMFDSEANSENEHRSLLKGQAQLTLDGIRPEMRPQLIFQASPERLDKSSFRHPLAVCTPIDALEGQYLTIPLDISYELLTKETLGRSTIQAPASEIISVILPNQINHNAWIESEASRVISTIASHPLPFVLKFTQTISGHGVHMIKTSAERDELCQKTLPTMLREHFSKLTSDNLHLKPCNLVLSRLIEDISANYSLTLFVHCDGHWTFNACGTQHLTTHNGADTQYAGTSVDYQSQDRLERDLEPTIKDIASFLHERGYYGPVGADVFVDEQGKQWVIDLNVRWTSSWVLGTLRAHFWNERELGCARLVMKQLRLGREGFASVMRKEVAEGTVVVVAWYEELGKDSSYAHLVVGGRNWNEVDDCVDRLNKECLADLDED